MARLVVLLALLAGAAPAASATTTARCQEDSPCWSWRTMGNHQRGIITTAGRRITVTATRFGAINAGCHIDWRRTRRLHGDGPRRCRLKHHPTRASSRAWALS